MKIPLISGSLTETCYTRYETGYSPAGPFLFDMCSVNYYDWGVGVTHNAGTTYEIEPDGSSAGNPFECLLTHVGSSASRPETGANWRTYWWKKFVGVPMPCAGKFSNLVYAVYTLASPNFSRATLLVNEEPTALTAIVTGPATYAEDVSNVVPVAAGDRVVLRQRGTLGSTIGFASRAGMLFEPSVPGLVPFLGVPNDSCSATQYHTLLGGVGTEAQAKCLVPVPGKFKNLYLDCETNLASGQSVTFTLRKNAASTSLAATLNGGLGYGNQGVSDTAHEVSVAAGDVVCLMSVCTGGYPRIRHSLCFEPDDKNVWWLPRCRGYDSMESGAGYSMPVVAGNISTSDRWTAAETELFIPGGCELTGIAAMLETAPGAGKSRTFTLRRHWADTDIAVTLSDSDTFKVVDGKKVLTTNGKCFAVRADTSGSPSSSRGFFSLIGNGLPLSVPGACVPRSIPALFVMS